MRLLVSDRTSHPRRWHVKKPMSKKTVCDLPMLGMRDRKHADTPIPCVECFAYISPTIMTQHYQRSTMSTESSEPKLESAPEPETVKPSKLKRIKSAATVAGIYAIPVTMVGGLMLFSYKTSQMDLEAARLNFEAAKLTRLADAATQQ